MAGTEATGLYANREAFGVGDFPVELARLNWGAFFFGWLWALVHGLARWFWLLAAFHVAWLWVMPLLYRSVGTSLVGGIALQVASSLLVYGALGVFAFNANRLAWNRTRNGIERRAVRGESWLPDAIGAWAKTERDWARVGFALLVISILSGAYLAIERNGTTALFFAGANVMLNLAPVLAVWLADRHRRRNQHLAAAGESELTSAST